MRTIVVVLAMLLLLFVGSTATQDLSVDALRDKADVKRIARCREPGDLFQTVLKFLEK